MYKCKYNLITMMLLATVMLCLAGCAHQPSAADINKVMNDKHLSAQQKNDAIMAMQPNPEMQTYEMSGGVAVLSILVLVVALIAKNKSAASSSKQVEPKKHAGAKTGATQYVRGQPATPASARAKGPSPSPHSTPVQPAPVPSAKIPTNQAEVDAIPIELLGVSFFTSRPVPVDALVDVSIFVGAQLRTVKATPQEVEQVRAGRIPLIRAFSVAKETAPWYEWEDYDPYRDYWRAESQRWEGLDEGVIACWMSPDKCDSRLTGFYHDEAEEEEFIGDDILPVERHIGDMDVIATAPSHDAPEIAEPADDGPPTEEVELIATEPTELVNAGKAEEEDDDPLLAEYSRVEHDEAAPDVAEHWHEPHVGDHDPSKGA